MFSIFSQTPKKKKILIIDDDSQMLKLYSSLFENDNVLEIITVNNKNDFLKNIAEVDAIVSDYHMKEVTEINFLRVLEICDSYKKPLLLLTGDIYPYYAYQLSKPVSRKSLKLNIEKMIERGYVESNKRPPKVMAA